MDICIGNSHKIKTIAADLLLLRNLSALLIILKLSSFWCIPMFFPESKKIVDDDGQCNDFFLSCSYATMS